MKTVVLIDIVAHGHHHGWLVQFADTLLSLGVTVVCLSPNPDGVRAAIAIRRPEGLSRLQTVMLENPGYKATTGRLDSFMESLRRWRHVAGALRRVLKAPPDLVFIAFIDHLMAPGVVPWLVDRIFPYPWAGLYFHPWMERSAQPATRACFLRQDACMRARHCRAVGILDEGVVGRIRQHVAPRPVVLFPDFAAPADGTELAKGSFAAIRSIAGSRTVVSVLGSLEPRKGVTTLLHVALREDMRDFFFVFAGTFLPALFSAEDRSIWGWALANPPGNCFFHMSRIESDGDFDDLVRGSDIIYAAYLKFFHSSNLLAKAAQFEKPIVVSRGYCMEERVNRFSLGIAVDEGSVEGSAAALRTLQKSVMNGEPGPARQFARYASEHSLAALERCFRELLEVCEIRETRETGEMCEAGARHACP